MVSILQDDAADKIIELEQLSWDVNSRSGREWQEELRAEIAQARQQYRRLLQAVPTLADRGENRLIGVDLLGDEGQIYGMGGINRFDVNAQGRVVIMQAFCSLNKKDEILKKAREMGFHVF